MGLYVYTPESDFCIAFNEQIDCWQHFRTFVFQFYTQSVLLELGPIK